MKTKNLLEEVVAEAKKQKQNGLGLLAEEIDSKDSVENDEPVDPEMEDAPEDTDALEKQDEITDDTPVKSLTVEDIKGILMQIIQDRKAEENVPEEEPETEEEPEEKTEEEPEDLLENFNKEQQDRMKFLAGLVD